MIPAFVLGAGEYMPPYESRWWPSEKRKQHEFINLPVYFQNSMFIAFDMFIGMERYFGLYDKVNNLHSELRVLKNKREDENPLKPTQQ